MLKKHPLISICAVFLALFLSGMVLATLFDLDISASLTNLSEEDGTIVLPIPALVVSALGQWPCTLFFCFCAAVIFRRLIGKRSAARYAGAAVCVLAVVLAVFLSSAYSVSAFNFLANDKYGFGAHDLIIAAPITIIVSLAVITTVLMIRASTADRLLVPAIVCISMILLLCAACGLFCLLWGRQSFYEIFIACDLSAFTPWFAPRFSAGGSFPSVTTALACALALIPILYSKRFTAREPFVKPLTYALAALWALIVAFCSIASGACFLSDALFGAMLGFAAVIGGHVFMNKIKEA